LPHYGVLRGEETSATFDLYASKGNPVTYEGSIENLPQNADYVAADFDEDGVLQIVFYEPGSPVLREYRWNGNAFIAVPEQQYPYPVDQLRVIDSTGHPQLLVIHSGTE